MGQYQYREIDIDELDLESGIGKVLLDIEQNPGLRSSKGQALYDNLEWHIQLVSARYDHGLVGQNYELTEKGKQVLQQLKDRG